MLAQVEIHVCDNHPDGVKIPATTKQHLSVNGTAATVELCPECYEMFVAPMLSLVQQHPKPKPRSRKIIKPAFECPECGKQMDNARSLGAHRWGSHRVKGARHDKK